MPELIANDFETTLTAQLNAGAGDLSVAVAAAAPTALQGGQWRAIVYDLDGDGDPQNEELVIVTATGGAGASPFTVTRAAEVPHDTRRVHPVGSILRHALTARGFARARDLPRDWDAASSSFPGFASMVIGRRLGTAVRMAQAQKHEPINTGARFEHPVKAGTETALLQEIVAGPDHHDPAHIAQVRADLATVVDAVRTQLTDIEVTVLARRLSGQTLGQAGHGLGRSHQGPAKVADNAMQRVRHKLTDALAA